MLFLNYHDKNKFVTNINPDDFKTGIIKSFRIKNCFHIYYFDNQGTFRKYIINDADIYKYIKPIKQEISRKKYKNYDEYKYYACYAKDLMRLKWTDDKTGEKLSYKIHFKQIYPNGNQNSYYVIKPAFPLSYNSNINQTFLRSAIERLIINKSTLQDMITIYNYIVKTSPDNRCIASIVDTKYPTKIQRYESKTDICLNSISSVNDDVKSFIYKIEYGVEPYECSYEIYPHTVNCYTPFEALLAGDITAIIERNENYCKSYNCGEYTLDKWNERVKSPEMQHYFDVIKSTTKGE